MMDYLNSRSNTPFGPGLGLEVGCSFWFFNETSTNQLSYFDRSDLREAEFAPHCREFWKSGHIDILHAYGNFDEGGFTRKHAEISLEELDKHEAKILTWVNHGNYENTQNLGFLTACYGACPERPEYHFDLLKNYGLRYVCTRFLTHIIGQDARPTLNIYFKNSLQKLLSKTKYRTFDVPIFDFQNRLLVETQLQNGDKIWDFQRFVNAWGGQQKQDIHDLAVQTTPRIIKRLLKNEGFLILYTHMFEGLHDFDALPLKVKQNFEYIARCYTEGKLFVTTTSRLLKYWEMTRFLKYQVREIGGVTELSIKPSIASLDNDLDIDVEFLQGLTFYCDQPEKLRVHFKGEPIITRYNPPDHTGRPSGSIIWQPLEYPRH